MAENVLAPLRCMACCTASRLHLTIRTQQ
jgi:hypothetical protein